MSCICEKITVKVCFLLEDITNDTITSIGGGAYAASSVANLVASNSQFWIEKDANGTDRLCTTKTDASALEGTFYNIMLGAYTRKAVLFDAILIGGHPIHRPPTR